jgi:hypothetical protein
MNKKRLLTCTFLMAGFWLTNVLQAQESVHATGGDISGSGGTVSYSVGQVVYQTHSGTHGSLAEGVQQPYEISVATALEEARGITLSVDAYPNPTTDFLTLHIQDRSGTKEDFVPVSYRLHDTNGRLLQSRLITGSRTIIGMGHLVPATYLVTVIRNNQEVKTFKIIKH